MVSRLYRFRPLQFLLGKQELENQEIFFAHPNSLNDPMEGLRDIFWQGDRILWKNLFRHYLICLDRACSLLVIGGEDHPIDWQHLPVVFLTDPHITPQHKALQDEICSSFFAEPAVQSHLDFLSNRPRPIRSDELAGYLRTLHTFAVLTVYGCYERHHLMPPETVKPELLENGRRTVAEAIKRFDHLKRVESEQQDCVEFIDALFAAERRMAAQLDLINQYNGKIDVTKTNRNFVFLKFCDDYVKQIERLVYPEWYTACFTADCSNSSIWGSYGRGHTGICLIFKVAESNGMPIIRLNRMMGWGSAGPIYGDMDHPFYEIKYGARPVEVDFFKSLGRMPIPMLRKYWYDDEAGQRSPAGEHLSQSGNEWRTAYWNNFNHSVTTKLADFSHEKEYRLVLPESLLDFSDESRRKVKYHFSDLEGIIFGIRTPEKEKLEIARVIETKCRAARRFDFKFYQAFYSERKGTIEHIEMSLLKFQQ